jgi:hypothetical protein
LLRVKIPVFRIWSTDDVALAEDQMIGSAAFVEGPRKDRPGTGPCSVLLAQWMDHGVRTRLFKQKDERRR